MAQKILQQSREAENALADALVKLLQLLLNYLPETLLFISRLLKKISKELQQENQVDYLMIIPMRVKLRVFVLRGLMIRTGGHQT